MSDLPPPPPPPRATPPPPPPPNLIAPPGAVAYAPSPMNSVRLDRVGRLATAVQTLALAAAVLSLVSIWASQAARDDARELLDGSISGDEFFERAAPYLLMTTVQGVATLATAIVTMIWMYRLAKNHRTLRRGGTWGPGWAIGGWLLPPLLYVIPTLMFRELWRASDPDVPIGGEWRKRPVTPLVWCWVATYVVAPLVIIVVQSSSGFSFGASERDMAQQVLDNQATTIIGAVFTVAAATVYVLFVRGLTDRHRRLTGEATAG